MQSSLTKAQSPSVAVEKTPRTHGDSDLAARYLEIRKSTEALCEPLAVEDYVIQTMTDVSPTKWHLAHTSWFFETFVLAAGGSSDYKPLDARYRYLFNSYYKGVGEAHCRNRRGVLSRPTVEEIYRYRHHVDEHVVRLLEKAGQGDSGRLRELITLGLNHEQQHQELILTDIKYVFWCNPTRPAYHASRAAGGGTTEALRWHRFDEGLYWTGHSGDGFGYDNESPRHRVFLEPFQIASRPVTNGEFAAFIDDGGYRRPELWLSDGWDTVEANEWQAPLYWEHGDGGQQVMTLAGMRALNEHAPRIVAQLVTNDAAGHGKIHVPARSELGKRAGFNLCRVQIQPSIARRWRHLVIRFPADLCDHRPRSSTLHFEQEPPIGLAQRLAGFRVHDIHDGSRLIRPRTVACVTAQAVTVLADDPDGRWICESKNG